MSQDKIQVYLLDVEDELISFIGYYNGNPSFGDIHEIEDLQNMTGLMDCENSTVLWL